MKITNEQLRETFLSPQMRCYFEKKLAPLTGDEVLVRIEETLKFLNIATYFHCSIPVAKEIDTIWHYWILETREYQKLCSMLQGGQFLHHSSNDYLRCQGEGAPLHENDLEEEVQMLATYVLNYGPLQEDRVKYWTFAAYIMEKSAWDVEQLNQWLASVEIVPCTGP